MTRPVRVEAAGSQQDRAESSSQRRLTSCRPRTIGPVNGGCPHRSRTIRGTRCRRNVHCTTHAPFSRAAGRNWPRPALGFDIEFPPVGHGQSIMRQLCRTPCRRPCSGRRASGSSLPGPEHRGVFHCITALSPYRPVRTPTSRQAPWPSTRGARPARALGYDGQGRLGWRGLGRHESHRDLPTVSDCPVTLGSATSAEIALELGHRRRA